MHTGNPRSTASIAGHPLHPMLIPFPVAFLVATLACDLLYMNTGNAAWATGAYYLLGAGVVMAVLAALMGITDFLGERRIRALSAAWHHFIGNALVLLLSIWNWWLRHEAGTGTVPATGVVLSAIVVLLLLYTGWRGWEMVYRHRVAVSEAPDARHG